MPKHQNKRAFKIQFDSQALQIQKKVSLRLLCERCCEQIQWKMTFNKYHKMTDVARCNLCSQKNITRSYMNACDACALTKPCCPKCLQSNGQAAQEILNGREQRLLENKRQSAIEAFLKTLRERSRRTIKRGIQKNTIVWNDQMEYFVDQNLQKIIGLHFKNLQLQQNQNSQDLQEEEKQQKLKKKQKKIKMQNNDKKQIQSLIKNQKNKGCQQNQNSSQQLQNQQSQQEQQSLQQQQAEQSQGQKKDILKNKQQLNKNRTKLQNDNISKLKQQIKQKEDSINIKFKKEQNNLQLKNENQIKQQQQKENNSQQNWEDVIAEQ